MRNISTKLSRHPYDISSVPLTPSPTNISAFWLCHTKRPMFDDSAVCLEPIPYPEASIVRWGFDLVFGSIQLLTADQPNACAHTDHTIQHKLGTIVTHFRNFLVYRVQCNSWIIRECGVMEPLEGCFFRLLCQSQSVYHKRTYHHQIMWRWAALVSVQLQTCSGWPTLVESCRPWLPRNQHLIVV